MYVRSSSFSSYSLPCTIFLFFFIIYLLFNSGHLGAFDAAMEYEVAKNFIRYKSFELLDPQFGEVDSARGIDGQLYSPHGLGASLAMIPFYLCGEWTAGFFPQLPETQIHHFFISLMNPMITALTCLMMFLFMKQLRVSEKNAFFISCIFGLFTQAFPYSKVSFDVVLTAFLYVTAAYIVIRYGQSTRSGWTFFVGCFLGFALLTRVATLIILPLFALYIYGKLREKQLPLFKISIKMSLFIIPIVAIMIVICWYNTIRFGIFFEDGHATDSAVKLTTPVVVGFVGQLFSPGKGLFLYSPILLFSIFGVKTLYRDHKWEALLIVGIIIINVLFHSKLVNWSGDWCWGPRFCVPIIPFICVLLGGIFNCGMLKRKTCLKNLWIALLALSFIIQILGVTIDGARRIGRRYTYHKTTPAQVYWEPVQSPIVDHGFLIPYVSFKPIPHHASNDLQGDGISYDDTAADFWFVYLYSLGFPLTLILGSMSILIIFELYCARVILQYLRSDKKIRC